jgi:hypothetical protein
MNARNAKSAKKIPRRQVINADLLRRAVAWAVNDCIFANVALHGNVSWMPSHLVALAVLWVWSSADQLTFAFAEAKQLSQAMFGVVAVTSYQGLTRALIRYTGALRPLLWQRLHHLMEMCGGEHWRIGNWLPLAIDGSRVSTPRTESNERAFAAPNFGKSAKARSGKKWKNKRRRSKPLAPIKPQIWLTLLWHMGLKMPWAWRCGPSTASERGHLVELLETNELPANTLICGDAGFVGYELWQTILQQGHHFLIRVGGNVRLLRKLGRCRFAADRVYLWPDNALKKQLPPIVLRLLKFKSSRGDVFVVTSVLSSKDLTASQASRLYRLRWGIELQFRTLKQTFGRTKLRSRTAESAVIELEWSLFGLWMIQLFAIKEQIAIDLSPEDCSVSLAIGVIQRAMHAWSEASGDGNEALAVRFRAATKDRYRRTRSKAARHRPKNNDIPSAGRPIISVATKSQRNAYAALEKLAA